MLENIAIKEEYENVILKYLISNQQQTTQ